METVPIRTKYGASETNGIVNPDEYFAINRPQVDLTDPNLAEITRLRLISDVGLPWWDLSYCHGVLKDGTEVRVQLPVGQFRKGRHLKGDLVKMCRDAGVFGKKLGLLEDHVISKCQ